MKKRVLSVLLAIVMVVGMFPVTAGALPAPHTHPVCGATCAHDGTHSTSDSWTELTTSSLSSGTLNGGSYYLGENITVTKEVAISGKVNLCLNGYSIENSTGSTIQTTIQVFSGATLNICDCTTGGTAGKIENTNNSTGSGTTTYGIYNSGTVNVYGGTISATTAATTTTGGSGSGIYNQSGQVTVVGTGAVVSGTLYGIYNNNANGTVSVSDGTVSGEYGIYNKGEVIVGGEIEVTGTDYGIYNSGTVTVSGGTVSGYTGINNSGIVNVSSNGTVQSTSSGRYGIYNSGGTVTVSGGTVQATTSNGQGIYNYSNGTVTVSGGTVQATGTNGKGICNYSGTVSVSDGSIVKGGSYGRGIYNSGGIVSVSGGSVTAPGVFNYGIENSSGTLKLSGAPTITGTTADVYLNSAIITIADELTYAANEAISVEMEDPGTFTSGWKTKMGGNAANYGSYFTSADNTYTVQPDGNELKLAEPSPTETHSHPICGATCTHEVEHNTLDSWTKLTASNLSNGTLSLTDGTSYYLGEDITVSSFVEISGEVNLCLNGHVLSLDESAEDCVIVVDANSTLNLCDCNGTSQSHKFAVDSNTGLWTPDEVSGTESVTGGVITGGKYGGIYAEGELNQYGGHIVGNQSEDGGGVYLYGEKNSESDKYRMFGGSVIGNTATECGGGIYIYRFAEFELHGGTVSSNRAGEQGGGIYTEQGGGTYTKFTMTDGTVSDNTAADGGGIYSSCDITMSGGSITGNSASATSGGVYARGTMAMSGGSITGNTAGTSGGGLWLYDSTDSYLIPSGKVVINNNTLTNGANNNVYTKTSFDTPVQISGTLEAGSIIGISFGRNHTDFHFAEPDGDTVTSLATGYKDYFFSDDSAYVVVVDGDNLKLAEPPAVETHSHPICGATCTHDDTHSPAENWTELTASDVSDGTLSLTDGTSYYLGEDISVSASVEISGTVNLCLNGRVLEYVGTGKESVIKVTSDATLTICDCTNTTHTGYINSDGLWEAGTPSGEEATVTLTGGIITGGTGYRFSDSNYYRYGGGIFVDGGTLNLYGGNIAGNLCAYESDLSKYGGGGVYVKNGTFNMYDGTITGNCAMTKTNGGGGGLYLDNSTFNMSGGKISQNKAHLASGNYGGYGGGIYVFGSNSQVNLSGIAEISGNCAYSNGGGINLATGSITMSGNVAIDGNEAQNGGGVSFKGNTFTINGGTISNNTATGSYGAGGVEMAGGSITMNDGSISNNTAAGTGGGVRVYDGTFTMAGGSISGNKTTGSAHGGGVYIYNNGSATFAMTAGKISGNTASGNGGGVYNDRVFQISGGEISGNIASVDGGGVYANKAVKLSGAPTISGNTVNENSNNVSVSTSVNITVVGELTNTTPIGVTVRSSGTGKFASPSSDVATLANGYADKFQSDNPAYAVAVEDTYLILAEAPHSHEYTYAVNTENAAQIIESCTCEHKETATLELDTTVSAVYNGSAIKALKVSYSDGWVGDKNAEISYTNNTNAGTASGSVTVGGLTVTKNFTITKKSAEAPAAPTAQNSITYGAELSEVGLTPGWTWADGNTIPTVNNSGYTAYYTPADVTNLDWTAVDGWNASAGRVERTVAVTVNKSAPTYTAPTGLTATYGDTLADVSLPSGWTWKTPSASVGNVGINSFKAVYTPSDTNNFNAAEVDVSVTVGKANSSYTAPKAKELVYNGSAQTLVNAGSTTTGAMQYALGSITEPTGSWSATLPQGQNAGTYYVWYKVVGDDNHNDVAPACVAVTIAKKQIAKPAADSSTFTYNGNYQTYAMNGDPAFSIANNEQKNAGSYTVTVTLRDTANYEWTDGTTAVLEYTFKIEQKEIDIGWDATMFLPYTGNSLLPKATATNLVDGDTCTLTTEVVETTEGAGVIPGEWTAKVTALSNNNYKLPASGVRVIVTFEIVNGYQNYAPVVSGTNETIDGKGDGKITGVDNTMEYRKEGETSYTAVSGSEVTGLHDGIYYVRYAAKTYYNPSPEAQLTIGAGRKLTVTVPQNQIGYTLITTTPELDYYGSIRVEFKLLPGYSMTENFEIYNGTEPIWQHFNQQTGILELTFVASDYDLTVAGVADISAPVAEIDIKNNKWTNFWNDITFGLFFNETQDVTITAADAGSGVNTIQYYLAGDELEIDEVRAITDWVDYNGTFKIDPNNHYVVYAKITDNAGNTLYINSDGIVLDIIAPTLEGIENGKTYYGDLTVIKSDEQFYDIKMVTLDGEPMGFAEGTYGLIPADNAEHIVVVQDHAGNKTTYTVTVMKNYTVTYKADGIVVGTQIVGHGKDATAPTIPEKEGYTQTAPVWDKDGKNITADTEINAVYTINEYTITFKDENGVYKTLTVKHGEAVTMPEAPAKDGYTVTWDTTIEKATDNATVNAVYTKNAVSDNPETGDNSNLWLWWILLIVSAASITVLCIEQKKRRATK